MNEQFEQDIEKIDKKSEPEHGAKLIARDGVAKKLIFKVLKTKLPIWFILLLVFISSLGFLVFKLKQDSAVTLEPLVRGSESIYVKVLVCNETIDQLNVDVRKQEKEFEKDYLQDVKVKSADVNIVRKDCKK